LLFLVLQTFQPPLAGSRYWLEMTVGLMCPVPVLLLNQPKWSLS